LGAGSELSHSPYIAGNRFPLDCLQCKSPEP
jgi:hypothetical protein